MMIKTCARKGKSIDEIIAGMKIPLPDIPQVIPVYQKLLYKTLQQCGEIVQKHEKTNDFLDSAYRIVDSCSQIEAVLSPEEINLFLQVANAEDQIQEYMAFFVNRLIQNSYQVGYHHFKLNLPSQFHLFGAELKGTQGVPLVVQVQGKTGNEVGWGAEYCHFNLQDTGDACGLHSKNCHFIIDSTARYCGERAEHCSFFVQKIKSDAHLTKAKYCSFSTPNRETLKIIKQRVRSPNRVIFVEPNGTEMIVRDYDD